MLCIVWFWVICGAVGRADYLQELAHGKPTKQSGFKEYFSDGYKFDGYSHFAVDGKPVTGPNQSCSVTQWSRAPWWMVDLEDVYLIRHVAITPRARSCAITNYTISVSRFWDNSTNKTVKPALCYTSGEKLPFGLRSVRACDNPVMGRYLRIAEFNAQEAALCICELEVYGSTTERIASFQSRPGKRSLGVQLWTYKVRNPVVCSTYCQRHPQCTSFNMAAGFGECELIADPLDNLDANEVPEPGWMRYTYVADSN